jgi:hypothetical protein
MAQTLLVRIAAYELAAAVEPEAKTRTKFAQLRARPS